MFLGAYSKFVREQNSFGEKILSFKDRKTAILNTQDIRMLQIHVNEDIYNKHCLIHNNTVIFTDVAAT